MNDIGFPWDVLGVGITLGGAAGLVIGYQTRKLVVRFQEWRANRYRKAAKRYDKLKKEAKEPGQPIFTSQQLPPTIPLKRSGVGLPEYNSDQVKRSRRSTPQTPQAITVVRDEPHWSDVRNPDRDDVIAALVNAGYKKADAVKAVDACSLTERASGPQQWTIAALRNVHGAK